MRRTVTGYSYLLLLAAATVALNFLARDQGLDHANSEVLVGYLCLSAALLNVPHVRIERGRLSLGGIALGASTLLLNPFNATVVGLASSLSFVRRGRFSVFANATLASAAGCLAAFATAYLRSQAALAIGPRLFVLVLWSGLDLILVAMIFRIRAGESLWRVISFSLSWSFVAAFAYMGLAALLVSYVLDGTPLGYLLATIVCVLALALTDTISGRRARRVLESELSDADRHLFHSRAVEGVVHNLRNHVATVVGYLREIDLRRLDPVDRESIETAASAANDAVAVLRTLSQGATPKVDYSLQPVDLNELVARALGMARPRARTKDVQLAVRESTEDVTVRADPLLMREVATNLINNAIDAARVGGRVELSTRRRSNGWPSFTVADNGPGVSESNRHHLFEPHYTTKEGGTGLGLFMSYGVVHEHQGDILYEGDRHGAVFTVILPPFGAG
jgi:signal transduction histidine kinase